MKNNKIKVRQKLANPIKDDLYVNSYARAALCIWQRFKPEATYVKLQYQQHNLRKVNFIPQPATLYK